MKKFILFMFILVLLVGTVSAAGWDNKLDYSNNDLKVNLTNWFGLGKDYGSVELKSHSSVDEVLKFGFGREEIVMYYDFNFVDLYENGLGTVTFTNVTTGEEVQKDYSFVEWIVKDESFNDYDWVNIGNTENGSIHWDYQIVGTHIESKGSWVDYNSNDIPNKNIRIGLKTFVDKNDYLDGVWEIGGKKVSRHAEWTATLEANMISWWALNGTSGGVVDAVGNATGWNGGADRGITGINNWSFDFEFTDGDKVTAGDDDIFDFQGLVEFSMCAWVDREAAHGNDFILSHDINAGQQYAFGMQNANKSFIEINGGAFSMTGNATIVSGSFTLICYVLHNDFVNLYVNGTIDGNATRISIDNGGQTNLTIGARAHTVSDFFDGKIDEVVVWNRSISTAEVENIYNDGKSCTFGLCDPIGPAVINVFSPTNITHTTSTIFFNATANQTISEWIVNYNGTNITSFSINSTLEVEDGFFQLLLYANGTTSPTVWGLNDSIFFTVDTSPTIKVFSPTNTTFTTSTIFFNATNSTQPVDKWIVNYNGTNITLSSINTTLTVEDGNNFQLLLYANNSDTGSFGLNDTIFFSVDANEPSLNVTEPFGVINFQDISNNQTLRFNVSDLNLDVCQFDYEGSNTTVDCSTNITNFTIGTDRTLTFFANDSLGNLASQVVNWSYLILQTSTTFNSSSFETANERFTVNVTTNGTTITAGSLTFDGTENTGATITSFTGDNFSVTKAIAIPTSIGTKTHNFNLTISGKVINTTAQTMIINSTNLTICGAAPQNIPFINFTFLNETLALENITATTTATFVFSLSAISGVNKTLVFTNATENPSYAFCGNPSDRTLNIDLTMTYNNDISQQRSFTLTTALSNVVLNQVLFLLPTTDGLFSPFVTVTTLGVAIPNVIATISRVIGGSTVTITSGLTDGSGFITFFLDPDESYTGAFSKSGFISQTFSFTPNSDLRTVTLARTSEAVTNGSEITLNTTFQITPINTTLINNTNVTFGFNVTSGQTITFMSLNITNSTGSQLGFTSQATQGFISVIVNTGNNTKLLGTFLFNTSEESITITRIWLVGNFFLGDYSIFNQLTLTVDNVLISEFFRFLLIIFTITGTIIFLTTREITDTSESKIIVITLLIWAFSLVGWLDTGILVPDSGEQINQIAQSSNQFGIAILTTIFTVFFISRRVFIRRI